MRSLSRLLMSVIGAALIVAAGISGVVMGGTGMISSLSSAQAQPLPPLAPAALEPSTVYADDGTTVLATFHASARRVPVALSAVPQVLINAVLDTEDQRFYIHGGFDIPSTLRAFANDSSSGGGLQGGSTITQQLVKQTYLNSQRKLSRKVKEAVLADRLQKKYSKNQILDAYLNTIYLGHGAYGVEAAANTYFNVDVSALTLPEAALLAGMIQNPNGYDPVLDAGAARTRRSEVLGRMVHYRTVTPAQAAVANATPLPTMVNVPSNPTTDENNDYYVQQVESQLLGASSPLGGTYSDRYNELFEGGLKIYTNLDPSIQAIAEAKTAAGTPSNSKGFEQASVSIDPATGKVRALVGGSGFTDSQFDIITQGERQPGSGFKLFTLLAALEKGYSVNDTILGASPCTLSFPGYGTATFNNDEGNGGGVETLVNATAQSTNCAYIRLAHEVGLPSVAAMAHSLGITENVPAYPSIVLGAVAVKPLEMAAAYATMADDGVYHAPTFIDHVTDRTGAVIYTGQDPGHQVVPSAIAREANVAFQAVVQNGTGTAAAIGRPVAGKTGTTENSDDAWFNGYVPQLETTVWLGSSAGETSMDGLGGYSQVVGGDFPAATWQQIMSDVLARQPVVDFPSAGSYPYGRYITSSALQQDDHSSYSGYYSGYGSYPTRHP